MYNCLAEANRAADVAGVLRYGKAYDCAISNNYAYMGGAGYQVEFVRCHVAGNMSNKEGGALKYASHARNCVFTDNCSTNGNGGAMDCQDGGSAYNCRFIRNWSEVQGGAIAGLRGVVSNCYFESNYARRGSSNGAIVGNANYVANNKVLDSVFTNNASGWGNAVGSSVSIWSNCTFVSNHVRSPAGGNAGPGGGSYYNCTFRDPWCASDANQSKPATNNYARILRWDRMVAVSGGKLYDCTVEGPVSGCTLTRCTLANVTNVAIVVNKSTLTNCLVVGNRVVSDNSQASQSVFAGDAGREIVNSTVVKNRGLLFNTVGTNVVNTLFADNVLANGTTSADISVGGSYAAVPVFDHCLYKTKSDTKGVYKACIQLGENETPKFNRGKHAGYPYYMTKRSSKAVDAGATVDWPEGAVDRGGYPRVTGSAVDIGCYESCLPVPGGLLLLR